MTAPSQSFALVTGTSTGIGEAVARELLGRGWRVVGLSRRTAALDDSAYTHLPLDLSDFDALTNRVDATVGPMVSDDAVTRVALVNNAADPGLLGPVDRIDPTEMHRVLAVNLAAPTWLMGWIVRRSAAHVPVRIVNVSSGAGTGAYPGLGTYGSTKAALRLIGMVFATELDAHDASHGEKRDVSILSFNPGPVDTPMQATARSAPVELFPLHETFARWAEDGTLMSPSVPATDIATYLESDDFPRFHEGRSGELR